MIVSFRFTFIFITCKIKRRNISTQYNDGYDQSIFSLPPKKTIKDISNIDFRKTAVYLELIIYESVLNNNC